ncbi:MAG: nucleoside hydrolase [Ardenticatenaceae bacterium]|nr:nucleoside hydrolase [Ardenticatenaceae bacterium]
MKRPVYLDVDTGIDDAMAILLAVRHPALEVRGITTVVGNVDLEQVTRNTLQVLDVAGASHVPVASGARRPLVAPPRPAAVVHGADGLGGAGLPLPGRPPVDMDAVAFLRAELLAADEPATIIALAPLTNIALLLQVAPEVKPKIRQIALMGGAVGSGNATPVAEFNIFHDPEAADIVFRSGVPILMYTLDVFRRVRFTSEEVDRWFDTASQSSRPPRTSAVSALVAHLLHFEMRNFGLPDATIGDAGCVASVIDPSGLTTRLLPVFVETGGRHCRGQTVVDRRDLPGSVRRPVSGSAPAMVDVALEIDADFYRRLFRDAILDAS